MRIGFSHRGKGSCVNLRTRRRDTTIYNFCRHREWKPQTDGMPPSMFEPNPNFPVPPLPPHDDHRDHGAHQAIHPFARPVVMRPCSNPSPLVVTPEVNPEVVAFDGSSPSFPWRRRTKPNRQSRHLNSAQEGQSRPAAAEKKKKLQQMTPPVAGRRECD